MAINPDFGMSEEQLDNRIKETAEENERRFQECVEALKTKMVEFDPHLLLGLFGYEAIVSESLRPNSRRESLTIIQAHVEFLQALVLKRPRSTFKDRQIVPSDYADVHSLLVPMLASASSRRLTAADDEVARRRQFNIEEVRMFTEMVRNWAYPRQVQRIVKGLFAPIEVELERDYGVRISHLMDMWAALVRLVLDRLHDFDRCLRQVRAAPSTNAEIERFCSAFPEVGETPEHLREIAQQFKADSGRFHQYLETAAEAAIPEIFRLNIEDFVRAYPVSVVQDQLLSIVNRWSIGFGETANVVEERLFLDNPIWERPIIAIDENQFYLPVPGMITSFCLEMMEGVAKLDPTLYRKYLDRRGAFLESEVEALFRAAFPMASVYAGSIWTDPVDGRTYENDLLVLVDTFAIVVEAKSGKVTASARRGAPDRLQRTIDDLIIQPSIQGKRFIDFLKHHPGPLQLSTTKRGVYNEVDTSNIREYVGVNVVLELVGSLNARVAHLKHSGFIPNDVEIGLSISLTDLEDVFEILDRSSEKMHYLVRRAEFEAHAQYIGDELDLLALYLQDGFNVGEMEFDGTPFMLLGWSERLNPYLARELTGRNTDKPRRRYTQFWKDLLRRQEVRKGPGWLRSTSILLNASVDDQVRFNSVFKQIQEQTKRKRESQPTIAFVTIGPSQRRDVLAAVAIFAATRDEAWRSLAIAAKKAGEIAQTPDAVVFLVDVARRDYPYSMMGYFNLAELEEVIDAEGTADRE